MISSSLWAVGGRARLQSVPPLDYPLSFPWQTPCHYPHPAPPVPFVQTVTDLEAAPASYSRLLPVEDTEVRGGRLSCLWAFKCRKLVGPGRLPHLQVTGPEFEEAWSW